MAVVWGNDEKAHRSFDHRRRGEEEEEARDQGGVQARFEVKEGGVRHQRTTVRIAEPFGRGVLRQQRRQ
ncbi:hypothetical protein E2562_000422 [Oryza meyeriana var. granulata]|uniref:Uncharacterized protein n=1 Tax=Oryza meyeriana var. granulata TaxID=110450 RepID=A0A6G1CC50_9ORYZ|nr:hypothetical protein E2562_000422 [Oryza meyeriana var. granulata]